MGDVLQTPAGLREKSGSGEVLLVSPSPVSAPGSLGQAGNGGLGTARETVSATFQAADGTGGNRFL